jgi:hypothetical protein
MGPSCYRVLPASCDCCCLCMRVTGIPGPACVGTSCTELTHVALRGSQTGSMDNRSRVMTPPNPISSPAPGASNSETELQSQTYWHVEFRKSGMVHSRNGCDRSIEVSVKLCAPHQPTATKNSNSSIEEHASGAARPCPTRFGFRERSGATAPCAGPP